MKYTTGRPPVYDEIVRLIGRPPAGAIFTWGDTIYLPRPPHGARLDLRDDLLVHEETHSRQQAIMGGPEQWWRKYLDDLEFRLAQELGAYRNQYLFIAARASRQVRRQMLTLLAKDLAAPMYGRLIKREEAVAAIRG